ncbi:urea ABC transporter permease subunit UrtB [Alcanivorax limicola]|nr:urea ABC transporter permease subunit UrtB [Alcanivorax limicola]
MWPMSVHAESGAHADNGGVAESFAQEERVQEANHDDFPALLAELATASFPRKVALVNELQLRGWPGVRDALAGLLEGDLYYQQDDADTVRVYVVSAQGDAVTLFDPVTQQILERDAMTGLRRITTNNPLRRNLRGAVARFDLQDASPAVRRDAVAELRRGLDDATIALLRAQQAHETHRGVARDIDVALALHDLEDADVAVRLAALEVLSGELGNDVYNRVQRLLATDASGEPLEPDAAVRQMAGRAIERIEQRRSFFGFLETLFFGLSFGSVLVLAAIGLAITFGVMGVINMAHGELIMIGAYTSYVVQLLMPNQIGVAILVAVPAAFMVSGLVGVLIERGVVRFLYGRPLETLLATFGISLILQQLVRTIFSPLNRQVQTPDWMSGLLRFNDVFAITYNRLYVLIFMFIVFALLWLVMHRTSLGLKVRAVSQNRAMARAMGVRSDRIDALTFGLGSGIAGVAGVALSLLTNVGPNMGQAYIIDSFMVVVFGGVGNLWGTLIGGLSLGLGTKLVEPHVGAVMAKILMLVFIILFIQKRKQGLFPQKGRSAEGH